MVKALRIVSRFTEGNSTIVDDGATPVVFGCKQRGCYPRVIVCPGAGKLSVRGKSLSISMMSPPQSKKAVPRSSAPGVTVVGRLPQCGDWFIAEGPSGYYLLEWYGGYDPSVGDKLAGDLDSFGFKDVLYTNLARDGRVYVDDYMLTRDSVIAKYKEKCR